MKAVDKSRKTSGGSGNNLKNYTEVDQFEFDEIYKQHGKTTEVFKIVEKDDPVRYYIMTKFLKRKKK